MPSTTTALSPAKRRRARRIPAEQWGVHKRTICQLHGSMTLKDLMAEMRDNHQFDANKRQWVHQLGKWGLKKYHIIPVEVAKPSRDDSSRHSERSERSSNEPAHLPLQHRGRIDKRMPSPRPGPVSAFQGGEGHHAAARQDQPDDWEECSIGQVPCRRLEHTTDCRFEARLDCGWSHTEHQIRLAADFLFAVSDYATAFDQYYQLFESLYRPSRVFDHFGPPLAVACVRSARREGHMARAGKLLDAIAHHQPPSRDSLFYQLLSIYSMHRTSPDQTIKQQAYNAMSFVAGTEQDGVILAKISRAHRSIDMPTYLLLDQTLRMYAEICGKTANDTLIAHTGNSFTRLDILNTFFAHQPLSLSPSHDHTTLHDCIIWCHQLLTSRLVNSNFPGHDMLRRSETMELFCLLWHSLHSANPEHHVARPSAPSWVLKCEQDFGLTPTEVLRVVCCIALDATSIQDGISKNTTTWRDSGVDIAAPHDNRDMLVRAAHGMEVLLIEVPERQFRLFLDKFVSVNDFQACPLDVSHTTTPVPPTDSAGNPDDPAVSRHAFFFLRVHDFVNDTLGTDIRTQRAPDRTDDHTHIPANASSHRPYVGRRTASDPRQISPGPGHRRTPHSRSTVNLVDSSADGSPRPSRPNAGGTAQGLRQHSYGHIVPSHPNAVPSAPTSPATGAYPDPNAGQVSSFPPGDQTIPSTIGPAQPSQPVLSTPPAPLDNGGKSAANQDSLVELS